MSVKKMVEMYIQFECGDNTWEMFYQMYLHGIIKYENWKKFFDKCRGWECVRNDQNFPMYICDSDGSIVFSYN